MKLNYLILIFLNFYIYFVKSQGPVYFPSDGNLNQLGSLLTLDTEVILSKPNGIVFIKDELSFKSLMVGLNSWETNITLDIYSPFTLKDSLSVEFDNTVNVYTPQGDDDHLDCPLIQVLKTESKFNNFGSISGKNTSFLIINGLLSNQGNLNVRIIGINNGTFKTYPRSTNALQSLISSSGRNELEGSFTFSSANSIDDIIFTSNSKSNFKDASVTSFLPGIQLLGTSDISLTSTEFTINRNDHLLGEIDISQQSNFNMFQKSYLNLFNVSITVKDSSTFTLESSTIDTDSNIRLLASTNLNVKDQSSLISSSPFLLRESSTFTIESQSNVESKSFYITQQSKVMVDNSLLTVGFSSNDRTGGIDSSDSSSSDDEPIGRKLIGLSHSANLLVTNSSQLNVKGLFGLVNDTNLLIDSSNLTVGKSFYTFDNANVTSNNSTFDINNSFSINDKSSFLFNNSNMFVNGSFEINSLNLNSKRQFLNSKIQVDGKFYNIGSLLFNNSNFELNKNFTTAGILNSLESKIKVKQGQFNILGQYNGIDDSIELTNGEMQIGPFSNFECNGCSITSIGQIKQAKKSKLSLVDSTLFNNGIGQVEISGDILLDSKSSLFNSGKFILEANINADEIITSQNSSKVQNNGTFEIVDNGSGKLNDTIVNVKFENNGILSLNQNSYFNQLDQYKGQLNLINNNQLSSNLDIGLQGGSVIGKGTLNATVINNAATIGDKQVTSLVIVGNYIQGVNATVIITINSKSDLSTIKVLGQSAIVQGGTLIVRVNKEMINDESNYNQSMPMMTSNSEAMSGDFSNIVFKTFTNDGSEDVEDDDQCRYNMEKTKSSFSLLLSSGCEDSKIVNNSGLTTPQIIGIAVGSFGVLLISGLIVTYIVFTKYRYSENSIKLKKWVSKLRN